jgi:hypothetical protein
MHHMKKLLATLLVGAFLGSGALSAQIIQFELLGRAGPGLLPGNELGPVVNGGTGGLIGSGIFFNTDTKVLTINVGWGSGNGFTDLSGNATVGHIHGPGDINTNAGVVIDFDMGAFTFNKSATNGSVIGSAILTGPQETNLLAGLWYINIHTAQNPPGEIRGNLIVIPEPSTYAALLGAAVLGLAWWRRRGQRSG